MKFARTLFKVRWAGRTAPRFMRGSPMPINTTFVTRCLNNSSMESTCIHKEGNMPTFIIHDPLMLHIDSWKHITRNFTIHHIESWNWLCWISQQSTTNLINYFMWLQITCKTTFPCCTESTPECTTNLHNNLNTWVVCTYNAMSRTNGYYPEGIS